MTLKFVVNRDSLEARTDFDAAMAHVRIGEFDTFDEAKNAMVAYINEELMMATRKMNAVKSPGASAAYKNITISRRASLHIAVRLTQDHANGPSDMIPWVADGGELRYAITTYDDVNFR